MTPISESRLEFTRIPTPQRSFPDVVMQGLSEPQKSLPCRYFYDAAGSDLFERICNLPEYYLTRTERAILERSAPAMIESIEASGNNLTLIEFGSGSSCKTRLLLDAALDRQRHLRYVPIDISSDFLYASACSLLLDYETLSITAIAAEYHDALDALPDNEGSRLFLFLGSNIGNFDPTEAIDFLGRIRNRMRPQDRILIGVDLLKDRNVIRAAYDDSEGVTALFNKNLLVRINNELGADFDLSAFDHAAPFVEAESRVEMRLIHRRASRIVRIAAVDFECRFEQGEYIHTENSYKYSLSSFASLCRAAGLALVEGWQDEREWFALVLLKPNTLLG